MLRALLIYIGTLAILPSAFAQKREAEKRIPAKRFPSLALGLLSDRFPSSTCKKYYLEMNGPDSSYEAKFKWEGAKYSVEFLPDGSLMDIEKKVTFTELIPAFRAAVEQQFGHDFKRYKVKKCQEQTRPGFQGKRYELEVEGKPISGKAAVFEYLFEENGALVQRREVLLPSNDINLY